MNVKFSGSWRIDPETYFVQPEQKGTQLIKEMKAAFKAHKKQINSLPDTVELRYHAYNNNGLVDKAIYVVNWPVHSPVYQRFWETGDQLVKKALKKAKKITEAPNAE